MRVSKKILFFLGSIFSFFLFFLSISFSACMSAPSSISVISGVSNLGDNFKSGDMIYIKSNLDTNPLKIRFNFINNLQANCFSSGADIKMKLFPNGNTQNSILTNVSLLNNTVFNSIGFFNFKIPGFIVSAPFISSFSIVSFGNPQFDGSLNFKLDSISPQLTIQTPIPNKVIYKVGEGVNIVYSIQDMGSGLDYLSISGAGFGSKIINFNSSSNLFNLNFGFNLSSSSILIFKAYDMLGNFVSKNISFVVDDVAPQIILNSNNFKFDKVYTYNGNLRMIKISNIVLSDSSFVLGLRPTFFGNFSSFNLNPNLYNASCVYDSISTNYICSFSDVVIDKISTTSNVNLNFKAVDFSGNFKDFTFQTSIFIDTTAPVISDFYLMNSVGVKNLATPFDNGSYIYLKFFDDSILLGNNLPAVAPNFDLLLMPALRNGSCTWDQTLGTGECIWDVGSRISSFLDAKKTGGVFSVQIYDQYRNLAQKNFTFNIDAQYPIVNKTQFIETNTVKDGIIKSGEVVDFKITIDDINLKNANNDYLLADFTRISSKVGIDIRKGNCALHNSSSISLYDCSFLGIKVRNGYRNDSIYFNISDSAGNQFYYKYNIEILKVGNESFNAFIVKDNNKFNPTPLNNLLILNPINRNVILKRSTRAWFEGNLTLKTPTDKFKLVNYAFKSCSFRSNTSLLKNKVGFYPSGTKLIEKVGDNIFALKIGLVHQSRIGVDALNDVIMDCQVSILTRDNMTIYPAEIVNFSTKIGFYDLPRGGILTAQAIKVNNLISKANFLGSWFDKTYKTYEVLKSVCTVVTTGAGILNTVNEIMNVVQYIAVECDGLSGGTCTGPMKSTTENGKNGLMEMLGKPGEYLKKACSYVTCSNGGLLGSVSGALGKIPGISDAVGAISDKTDSATAVVCGKGEPTNVNSEIPTITKGSSPTRRLFGTF